VLQAARENLRRGATQIKIAVGGGISSYADPLDVTQYTEDEIRAAVEAAESWGTYVAAHVYNSKGVRRAIDLGVKSIEHANLIDRDTLKLMQEKGVWLSPQVMIFEQKINGFNEDQLAKQRQAAEGLDALMRHAADLDYRNIVFGEDMVTSLEGLNRINQELVRRRQWFSPLQILRQATSRAGELCMLSGPRNPYGTVGVIKEGALADLLIVEGNPLEDISVLAEPKENLRLIMKGGKVYKNTL
jgi:imidazolonepropionase-like amidohydrolase